jgi:hypothetical protein
MKKKATKLQLSRETLEKLSAGELNNIEGGAACTGCNSGCCPPSK